MTDELDILKIVADNPEISQRKIAEKTGISLGQVNFLLKKFAKKGLIKIEGQTTKSLKYNLTPKGLSEKAALTFEYMKISYAAVVMLTDKIRSLAEQYIGFGEPVYVCGADDEIMEICKIALGSRVEYIYDAEVLKNIEPKGVVLYWDEKNRMVFEKMKAVNILL